MEVKNNIKNILLWVWHILIVIFAYFSAICTFVSLVMLFFFSLQEAKLSKFSEYFIFFVLLVVPFFTNYLIFKIFGTFKFLDKNIKNIFLKILFPILISTPSMLIVFKDMFSFDNIYDINCILYFIFLPTLPYLIYKLTKKLTEKQNKNNKIKNTLLWIWQVLVILFTFLIAIMAHLLGSPDIYSYILSFKEEYIYVLLNTIHILIAFIVPIFISYLIFKTFDTFKFLDENIKNIFLKIFVLFIISTLCIFALFKDTNSFENVNDIGYILYFSFLPALSYLIYKIRKKSKKKHKLLHQAQPVNKDKSA